MDAPTNERNERLAVYRPNDGPAGPKVLDAGGHEHDKKWVIGRSPNCDIVITDGWVSSRHAFLGYDEYDEIWQVQDNNSSNGTWLNGKRIAPKEWVNIREGDRIFLAQPEISMVLSYRADGTLEAKHSVEEMTDSQPEPSAPIPLGEDNISLPKDKVQGGLWLISHGPKSINEWLWRIFLAVVGLCLALLIWGFAL